MEEIRKVQLMEKALAEIQKLPEAEQESLAAWILDELASEHRWSESFAASENLLTQLADESLTEHQYLHTARI